MNEDDLRKAFGRMLAAGDLLMPLSPRLREAMVNRMILGPSYRADYTQHKHEWFPERRAGVNFAWEFVLGVVAPSNTPEKRLQDLLLYLEDSNIP